MLALFVALQSVQAWFAASFRKDAYLDPKLYVEDFAPNPTTGGRVHFLLPFLDNATSSTWPFNLLLNGEAATLDYPTLRLPADVDWARVEADAGARLVWVALHSRAEAFMAGLGQLEVRDASGATVAAAAVRVPSPHAVTLTYVATQKAFRELVVHLQNADAIPHVVTQLHADGREALGAPLTLAAGEHQVLVVSLPSPKREGQLWTVRAIVDGADLAWGGVHIKELFPFENWPKDDQCPFPASNRTNFDTLAALGIDCSFLRMKECGVSSLVVVEQAAANGYTVLPDEAHTLQEPNYFKPEHYPAIAALFISDEGDKSWSDTARLLNESLRRRRNYPELATYMGGHVNKYTGTFAGITDIMGMDYYVAQCAPHVTGALSPMRIQGTFDYLRVTRENHKPLPVWGYSQSSCADCWTLKDGLNEGEQTSALASVFAAGNKGLMLFMGDVRRADVPGWRAGAALLRSFRAVREALRVGDVMDSALTSSDGVEQSVAVAIQSPTGIVIIVINMNADTYSDITCAAHVGAHWIFHPHTVQRISISLPAGFRLKDVTEFVDGNDQAGTVHYSVAGSALVLTEVELGTANTTRVFWAARE